MASINASTSGAGGVITTADNTGNLNLQTASTTAVTIDTSQNINIGQTSTPSAWGVQAKVSVKQSSVSGAAGFLSFSSSNENAIFLGYDSTNSLGRIGVSYGSTGSFTPLAFETGGSERMRIDSSGYVRVNNTTGIDGQFSSVAGAYYAGAFSNTDATYPVTYNWNKATSGNNLFMTFYTEGTAQSRGTIDYNRAGNAVRYNTTSDQRLKENIVDAPSATDLINSVKIRSFDWKETGFHVDYGVIAQELNEVVPDAVSEGLDNEDGTIKQAWGVDTSVLVPALVKAIQEQQTLIVSQSELINSLTARVTALEAK